MTSPFIDNHSFHSRAKNVHFWVSESTFFLFAGYKNFIPERLTYWLDDHLVQKSRSLINLFFPHNNLNSWDYHDLGKLCEEVKDKYLKMAQPPASHGKCKWFNDSIVWPVSLLHRMNLNNTHTHTPNQQQSQGCICSLSNKLVLLKPIKTQTWRIKTCSDWKLPLWL